MSDATRIANLEGTLADVSAYLDELRSALASHDSALGSIRLRELEQKISPSLTGPGVPTRRVGSDVVANTLGNTLPNAGSANLLSDPLLDTFGPDTAITITTRTRLVGRWYGWYVLNSGSSTSAAKIADVYDRVPHMGANPFNSGIARIRGPAGTAANDATVYLDQEDTLNSSLLPSVPYVVAAVKVVKYATDPAYLTAAEATMELYNTTTATVAASTTVDLAALPLKVPSTLYCSVQQTGDNYRWRLKCHLAKSSSAGAADCVPVYFGEPQLHQSYTPDPISFAPLAGQWVPTSLEAFLASWGPEPVAYLGGYGLEFSSGLAAYDARLRRSGTKTITIDDGADGAATLNVVGAIQNGGTQVVGSRQTGWAAPTGTATRTTFATDSVTLIELARRVKALVDDLTTHGLIGT